MRSPQSRVCLCKLAIEFGSVFRIVYGFQLFSSLRVGRSSVREVDWARCVLSNGFCVFRNGSAVVFVGHELVALRLELLGRLLVAFADGPGRGCRLGRL